MALRHILSNRLFTCSPETPVCEIAKLMRDEDIGAVVVTEKKIPVGIVTDRDLTLRCIAEARESSMMTAEDVMSGGVETVSDDEGIYDVIQKMRGGWVRRVPIVNAMGEAVGLLSFDDIFDLIAEEMGALQEVVRPFCSKLSEKVA
jgi:CBS domain-containing protein